ncbi:plasma kallikrein-like [Spodoptera litura]|uniref:Plasma kallikrein-like n=1 Tax=Spodoptera litura TaxID=69820 RepID=A0A9J7EUN8_SPOLT|nr:plasma kallikrein-like [Spodoptera litura]
MWDKILFLFCVTATLWEVNSVYLKNTVPTEKYVPCNLGLLHFDKVRENYWKCTVNFGLYDMTDAVMSIVFNNKINVDTYPNNYFTVQKTNKYSLLISSKQLLLEKFVFNVSTENLKKNDNDVPVVSLLTLNNIPLCNERIKAALRAIPANVTHSHSGKLHAHFCGRRPINHTELVTTRTEAQQGDWPWHVALYLKESRNTISYHCGGNVISRTAILTSAHCVSNNGVLRNVSSIYIVAGVSNLTNSKQPGRQKLVIEQIIMHPAYKSGDPTSDLAIIKVKNIDFTDYVQPICVWGPVFDKHKFYYKEATMVGFGLTERNMVSTILRSTHVKVQNDSTCTSFMETYKLYLNDFTICAGNGPNSTANPLNGDSGGGLVFSTMQPDHKISWFLRGVFSKCFPSPGASVCNSSYYVVYTDVGPYYGWIYYHADLDFSDNVMVSYIN